MEGGAAGLLLIGGVLVWAVIRFARASWAAVDPLLKGVGAAGIGLFAESLIYPTLEVQLIALTWWLLLVLCLKDPAPTAWIRAQAASRRGGGPCPDREFAKIGEPVTRFKLIAALGISLALVGGLVLSLLDGDETQGTQPAAAAVHEEFFGIVQGIRLDREDFETMQETAVGSSRFLLFWDQVQPERGSFEWGPADALVGGFASHGIRAVPFLWGSPPWVASTIARPPLDGLEDVQAWQDFLEAAVARYGRGGIYWAKEYRQRYGADAKPLPVQSWQIWNEPNLSKYFAPKPSVEEYAELLGVSNEVIQREDPEAQIVLAGMPGYGEVNAWDYLDSLYSESQTKDHFDAVALHPYAPKLDELRQEIERLRKVMEEHGDRATPLWLTEMGWGSAPPDRFGLNKGVAGQEKMLEGSFKLILRQRKAWNVGRIFWFDWRDPLDPEAVDCSFCAYAGLLRSNRSPKPAYHSFKRFADAR